MNSPTGPSTGPASPEARLKSLMLAGLDGDAAAQAQLLRGLSPYLRAYFARRLGAYSADAEDLLQDTLIAIHLKRSSYDRRQPFTAWAYAVARYKLIDHFRRRGRRPTVPLEDAGVLFAAETAEEGAVQADLDALLAKLPQRQRDLVRDVKLKGLTIEEAAAQRGVSAVSARVMLHRSLKWLSQAVRHEDR